jgi:AcrR family transcriptional regulator
MPAPRPYDASSRLESAARNRAAVLAACRELLFRDGYHRMTVRSVAERAGVSPETVYKAFGGKPGLMKALWDVTLAGDDEPVAIADRPQMREVQTVREPAEKLRRWAAFVSGANQRLATLYGLLAQAGPEVTQMLATTQQERLTGVRALVTHLSDSGLLAPGLDQATAADACWALTGPRLFLDLTTERGWPPGQYEAWLTRMLTANLLVSDPGLQGAYAGAFPACGHARDRGN